MRILLVCNAGMSTSILVEKMREYAVAENITCTINAISEAEVESYWREYDVILLGPQIRFMLPTVKKIVGESIPVVAIEQMMYGRMDGEGVLNLALSQ